MIDESNSAVLNASEMLSPHCHNAKSPTKTHHTADKTPEDESKVANMSDNENNNINNINDSDRGDGCAGDEDNLSGDTAGSSDPEFDSVEREARIVLEAVAMEEDVKGRIPEYISKLQHYRNMCEERSMYKEAHLIQHVLSSLRLEEETRHVRGMTEQQMQERRRLEDTHKDEFRRFHSEWNKKIDLFEEQQLEQEVVMLERQNDELESFHAEMREFNPRILRYSRALIHTRTRQRSLAKERRYASAHAERSKADIIEANDRQRFDAEKTAIYGRRERALRQRHNQELLALRMKYDSKRLYLERHRKRELDELLLRYINIRRELEMQQNIIRSRVGAVLLKHACNSKTDISGSVTLVESAESGAFGRLVQRRFAEESRHKASADSEDTLAESDHMSAVETKT